MNKETIKPAFFPSIKYRKIIQKTNEMKAEITKGMKIYAEGRLKTDTWTGNDGQNRFRLQINADRILFLDRSGEFSQAKPEESAQPSEPNNQSDTTEAAPPEDVEDLPW